MKPPLIKRVGRGALKLAKWLFGLAIVTVLGLYGYVRYDLSSAAGDLENEREIADSLGLPLTPESMKFSPAVAPAENAAAIYREISKALQKEEERHSVFQTALTSAKDPKSSVASAEKVCRQYSNVISLARSAGRRPFADFERDWYEAAFFDLPEFSGQKDAAKLLCLHALVMARSNQIDSAVEDLRSAVMIAHHAGQERMLISGLVSIGIDAIVVQTITAVATFRAGDSSDLGKLARLVDGLPRAPDFERAMRSEVFYGYWTSLNLSKFKKRWESESEADESLDWGADPWRVFPPLIESKLIEQAYASRTLHYWNRAFSQMRTGAPKPRQVGAELDRLAVDAAESNRPSDVLVAALFPVFSQAGMAFEKVVANRDCANALIQVLLFKNRKGRLPKTLKEAGVETVDPFDEKPFKFRVTDFGFVVYSAGMNGKDDGGLLPWEITGPYSSEKRDLPMAVFPSWEWSREVKRPASPEVEFER